MGYHKMTLEEAAKILGVSVNADAKEINGSYRKKVALYHPDANRNKSDAERKHAEMMFKSVAAARKVMLNPETADAAPAPQSNSQSSSSSSSRGFGVPPTQTAKRNVRHSNASGSSMPNRGANNASSGGTSGFSGYNQPNKHRATEGDSSSRYRNEELNTATTFNDGVEHVPDSQENSLHAMYKKNTHNWYAKKFDIFRATPSLCSSIFIIVAAVACLFMSNAQSIAELSPYSTIIIGALCGIVKLIYDILISYFPYKMLRKKGTGAWLILTGIEDIIFGIIVTAVCITLSANDSPLFLCLALGLALFGIVSIIIGVLRRRSAKNKENVRI